MTEEAAKLCRELIASKGSPAIVGGVALQRVIGAGGMGVVYHGTHLRLRIPVAVKFLTLDREDSYSVSRFIDEASFAAKIDSPNVVRVYDVNKEGPFEYIIQEYVNGQTADQHARDAAYCGRKLSEDFVLELAADTARGLGAIHALDYLHLDIKPANIIVAKRDGVCKILDFGLAQPYNKNALPGTPPNSDVRAIDGGTPGYASPEQLQMLNAGPSSDIYSLGVSMFELLTGRRAFNVETWEMAQEVQCKEVVPDVRSLRPEISSSTAALIERCLRLDPLKRFDSAMELLSAIAQVKQQRLTAAPAPLTVPAQTGSEKRASGRNSESVPYVVCVDDNAQICMLMSELLSEAGFRAETFTDGARAMQKMRAQIPDVVFLDMEMPGMTGLDVCSTMRASPLLKNVPVVFITGETSPETMRRAMHEGATDYLFKPVQSEELISRVKCLTRISRAQQELARLERQFGDFRRRLSTLTGKELA